MSDILRHTEDSNLISGERVAALMWRQKLSQRRLGLAIGVDPALLGKKLRGGRPWYLHEAKALAELLGVSLGYLMGETDEETPAHGGMQKAPASSETGATVAGTGFEPATSGL
ncbi:helix-turn-helix domain-containing protein [Humibacter albus]|uniref:helix-turn-helix domain-containing protein n=1 Tax=Humibacter albus TaxID=427754 RepID=UPI000A019857|nr:helix-turn-helix domain-containing protein [Humibacter albus]